MADTLTASNRPAERARAYLAALTPLQWLYVGLTAVFATALWLTLTAPLSDHDFWWHLATGRWIADYGLPSYDPFNFTSAGMEPTLRSELILQQYWWSQLLLHVTQAVAGFQGLIVLRATVLLGMFAALVVLLRRAGVAALPALLLLLPATLTIGYEIHYIGARPQMFTSAAFPLLILLLDLARDGHTKARWALPITMLIWANLHGGFVLGDVVILIYLGSEALRWLRTRKLDKQFLYFAGGAIVASAINPNGFGAFVATFAAFLDAESAKYWSSVVESQSLLTHGGWGGVARRLPWLTALTIAATASWLLRLPRFQGVRLERLALFVMTLLMATQSIRYIIFFCVVATLVLAENVVARAEPLTKAITARPQVRSALAVVLAAAVLTGTVYLGNRGWNRSGLGPAPIYFAAEQRAAWFLSSIGIEGRAFNEYSAGGFLIWALHPRVQVFTDGRALSIDGFDLYRRISDQPFTRVPGSMQPFWQQQLDHYGIDLVILPGCDRVSGITIPVSYALLDSVDWAVLYADGETIVHARTGPKYQALLAKHGKPKSEGYRNVLTLASRALRGGHASMMPGIRLSMAIGSMGIGDKPNAQRWISEYLRMVPNDQNAQMIRRKVEAMP